MKSRRSVLSSRYRPVSPWVQMVADLGGFSAYLSGSSLYDPLYGSVDSSTSEYRLVNFGVMPDLVEGPNGRSGRKFNANGALRGGYRSLSEFPQVVLNFSIESWVKYSPGIGVYGYLVQSPLPIYSTNVDTLSFSGIPSGYTMDLGDGDWHHIVQVRDGSTFSLYVDNSLIVSRSGSLSIYNSTLTIGGYPTGTYPDLTVTSALNVEVSSIGMYPISLSPSDINDLYTVVG